MNVEAIKTPWIRKIIHIDMDAFFAAVEQRDHPQYRGKPLIVGGDPNSRGVVSTCSYEARKFGIHSAMSSAKAYRLCPQAIFVRPRFEAYQQASSLVMSILRQHSFQVEKVSIDEAYMDVTHSKLGMEDPVEIAKLIKQNIFAATKLTASAGVASYMFLAKIASDFQKPNGLTVVRPGEEALFLEPLSIRVIPGVGPVTEKQLEKLGLRSCSDVATASSDWLYEKLGSYGLDLQTRARGIDERQVTPHSDRKQSSCEETFEQDVLNVEWMKEKLEDFAKEIFTELTLKKQMGLTIVLKVKYFDFEQITRSQTLDHEPLGWNEIHQIACQLLETKTKAGQKSIRLLGLGITGLQTLKDLRAKRTPDLFADAGLLG